MITRFGPRLGLTEARLGRAAALAEARGRPGLAVGRALPGLRTLTVIAAGVSGLAGRRALPALILGSSVFLQVHLVLGLLLGPLATFDQAKGPALAAAAVLAAATLIFWRTRRRRRAAPAAWMEATCPACIAVNLLTERVPALAELTGPDPARSGARTGAYPACRSRAWQRSARSTSSRPSMSRRRSAAGGSSRAM